MNRLAPFLSEGSPPGQRPGGLKLLKKRQRHFFEKSHTQGVLHSQRKSRPTLREKWSFPTRMSPEMTGSNFIPSPAGDGTPCGRAFRGENKFASGDEIGADLLYNRGDNGRRRRGYGVEENGAMTVIAHIESQFHTKFGIPRQSGLVEELEAGRRVRTPVSGPQCAAGAGRIFPYLAYLGLFRGQGQRAGRPLIRPPRLGGTADWEIFATRSPFRPNPIG